MAYQSEIEKLEQRYRENPEQWFAALADSYRKAGDLDLALDVVKVGLDKRPNYVSGHIVLGRCLLQKKDDTAAHQAFERVLTLDGENVIALKALSEISERAGQMDDATRWMARLLEVDPMNEEAEQNLARLKQAALSAPAAAVVPASPLAPALPTAPAAPAATTPSGFEATVAEAPASTPSSRVSQPFTIEKSEEPYADSQRGAAKPGLLDLDNALAPGGPGDTMEEAPPPSAVAPASGVVESVEFAPPARGEVAPAPGVEQLAFQPPPAGEAAPAPPGLEAMEFVPPPDTQQPPPAAGAQPFDDQLAWGTGERISQKVSQADIAAAEKAHEPTLDTPAHAAGLEGAGAPPAPPADKAPASDALPLFFPDEPPPPPPSPAREPDAGGVSEPEPVVTETMAELYAKQGLLVEARGIYRKLVARRPRDAALAARLAQLEGAGAGAAMAGASGGPPLTAASTGGPSVRDFLAQVFGGVRSGGPAAAAPAVNPAPPQATPDASLAGEPSEPAPAPGAPTRRASDEVSLAAVFGDEPPPVQRPGPPAPPAKSGGAGFSFDEFFGGQGKPPAPGQAAEGKDAPTSDGEDEFKRWLKGLKS